jgi:DNA-binding LytR/AlgR family response regulator
MIRSKTTDTNLAANRKNPAFSGRKGQPRENSSPSGQETILIEKGKLSVRIPVRNILFVKSEHVYCRIFFFNDQRVLQRISLANLLRNLPEGKFLRVHRSYAINVDYVQKFSRSWIQLGGAKIPIGRTWRAEALARLGRETG